MKNNSDYLKEKIIPKFRIIFSFLFLLSFLFTNILKVNAQNSFPKDSTIIAKANYYISLAYSNPLHSSDFQIYIDSALQLLPNNAFLWQQKSMPYFKAQKYEVGIPYLDKAVSLDSIKYLDYKAFIKCIFQKSYQESINLFTLLKTLPNMKGNVMDHSYDFYIGLSYLQLNDFDSALHYFQIDISNEIKMWGEENSPYLPLFYVGIVFYEKNDWSNAIIYFDKALKRYPNFSEGRYYKALCLIKLKKINEGVDLLKSSNSNFKFGYTINETNADYEKYPYQLDKSIIEATLIKLIPNSE